MSGICAVYSPETDDCLSDIFYIADYHLHLGSERAGIASRTNKGGWWNKIHNISQGGQFKDRFTSDLDALRDVLVRDGSSPKLTAAIGAISDQDSQPLIVKSQFGSFAIAGTGLITNLPAMIDELLGGHTLTESGTGQLNGIEVCSHIIGLKDNLVDGIEFLWSKIQGSMSLVIITDMGKIIAARDRFGVSNMVIGQKDDGSLATANEDFSLTQMGYTVDHQMQPGEITEIGPAGLTILKEGVPDRCRICSFLWIYTSFPATTHMGQNVEMVRNRCGACLASRDTVEADFVDGVADSGIGHAVGYANEAVIPRLRCMVKYTPGWGRSYTPATQEQRDLVAGKKLVSLPGIVRGQRIVLTDDSIVRGTQLFGITSMLWDCQPKEIHARPACPPLMFPCRYLRSTRKEAELIARRAIAEIASDDASLDRFLNPDSAGFSRMLEWIRQQVNADTLQYQRLDDMIEAIGIPRKNLCTYCWTGEKIPEDTYEIVH